jgi:CheY-like chemotaxis protein
MPENPPVIAVVDDEPRMRAALSRLLRARGYGVVSFEDGALFGAPNIQAICGKMYHIQCVRLRPFLTKEGAFATGKV